MNQTRRALAGAAIAALIALGCGGATSSQQAPANIQQPPDKVGGGTDKITLELAIGEGGNEAEFFAENIRKISSGSIDIRIVGQWRDGEPEYEAGIIEDVAAGRSDLGMVGVRAFDRVGVKSFQGLMAPFLVDSLDVAERFLDSPLALELLDELDAAGVQGIGYRMEQIRRPIGISRDFTRLDDFAGATFGIRGSGVSEKTLRALGAIPVVNPGGDATGLDGLEGGLATAAEYAQKGARSVSTNVNLWPRTYVVFMRAATYAELSTVQQQALRGAAAASFQESIPVMRSLVEENHGIVCTAGLSLMTASDADLAELRAAVQPVYDELEKDARTKEVMDAIRAIRGTGPAQSLQPCAATAPSEQPTGPTPIDGVWTTTFTKEELANSPKLYDPGEINDQNWGDFRLTLGDGRAEFVQQNEIDQYTTSGTFTVEGDVVTLRFLTGGNANETFAMRWSLFEGTLTLDRIPGEIAPTPYVLQAWTKTG